jgi:hypothetical protein
MDERVFGPRNCLMRLVMESKVCGGLDGPQLETR